MAEAVYILCAMTSLLCAVLLLRRYRTSRSTLLLWSSVCFTGLAFNNAVLFADLVVFPSVDLAPLRHISALASLSVLLYGLVDSS